MSDNIWYRIGSSLPFVGSIVRENHKTHVANAYGKTIYARVAPNMQLTLKDEFNINVPIEGVSVGKNFYVLLNLKLGKK